MTDWYDHRSGLGAERTDATLKADTHRPIWRLFPLPLQQVQPLHDVDPARGPVASLHSHCLAAISKHFHLFSPSSFDGVDVSLVRRVLSRVRADRRYESVQKGQKHACRPDESTVWGFAALLDPEGTAQHHTLALSTDAVLPALGRKPTSPEDALPFLELPRMFRQMPHDGFCMLTTLSLSSINRVVNDSTIQALRACTHLDVLWTRGCHFTDDGIRLLASSLQLPGAEGGEGRGMWRLRAWYLTGCKGVGDKAMRSLARWPGLTLLDLRETSCTTVALDIFNRHSRAYFACQNADLQPCTDGLRQLFSLAPPGRIIDNLALTLTPTPPSPPEAGQSRLRRHLALHIVPTTQPLDPSWLPQVPKSHSRQKRIPHEDGLDPNRKSGSSTVYRSDGIGQVYGTDVARIHDAASEYRDAKQRREDAIMWAEYWEEERRPKRAKRDKLDKFRPWVKKNEKREAWERPVPMAGKIFKEKKADADARSREFVAATLRARRAEDSDDEDALAGAGTGIAQVKGDAGMMLVRMTREHWETLQWAKTPVVEETSHLLPGGSGSQKIRHGRMDILDDLLSSASQPTSTLAPGRRSAPTSLPSSSPPSVLSSPPLSSAPPTQSSSNPFKKPSAGPTNPFGVKPLAASGGVRPLAPAASTDDNVSSQGSISTHGVLSQKTTSSLSVDSSAAVKRKRFGGPGVSAETAPKVFRIFSKSR